MTNVLRYTTVSEQIELLKSKGLLFKDEHAASELLNTHGYYNIITNQTIK